MNKYALMLVAAGLIAAAPAYYAFQAQAEEKEPAGQAAATTTASKQTDADAAKANKAAPAAGGQEKQAGEAQGTNQ